jgi:hypothetical protein
VRALAAAGLRLAGALLFGGARRAATLLGAAFFGLVLLVPGFLPGIDALLIHHRSNRHRPF